MAAAAGDICTSMRKPKNKGRAERRKNRTPITMLQLQENCGAEYWCRVIQSTKQRARAAGAIGRALLISAAVAVSRRRSTKGSLKSKLCS